MKEQKSHIDLRVSPEEKQKIDCIAAKCGLSTSEYLRQRALGFAPRAVPPESFWRFCEVAGELMEKGITTEVHDALLQIIHDTAEDILIPGKDRPKYAPKAKQRKPPERRIPARISMIDDNEELWDFDPFDNSEVMR